MTRTRTLLWIALSLFLTVLSPSSFAETVELVTYYPTTFSGTAERFHSGGATIGDPPYSLTNPSYDLNGILLVSDSVGIGPGFGTTPPAGALHVVGAANQGDRVLFLPGAGGTLNVGIGTVNPQQTFSIEGAPAGTLLAGLSNTNAAGSAEWRIGQGLADNGQHLSLGYANDGSAADRYLQPNQGHLIAESGATNGLVIGTEANAPLTFVTNGAAGNNERMRITGDGNVGIGNTYNPATAAPNGQPAGNLDVNDIFLRATGRWASQAAGGGSSAPDAVGTYTGNGAIDRFIATNYTGTPNGFRPGYVLIWQQHTVANTPGSHLHIYKKWANQPVLPGQTADHSFYIDALLDDNVRLTYLELRAGENGFRVGAGSTIDTNTDQWQTNVRNSPYYWMAWD